MDFQAIIKGWAKLALDQFNLLDPQTKQLAEQRLNLCHTCPMRNNNSCDSDKTGKVIKDFMYKDEQRYKGQLSSGCGCNISAKTLSKESQCPLGKW